MGVLSERNAMRAFTKLRARFKVVQILDVENARPSVSLPVRGTDCPPLGEICTVDLAESS